MRVTLIAGRPRQGKTTLALERGRAEAQRLLVFDPANSQVLREVPGFATWRELATWLASPDAGGRWERALRSKEPRDYVEALRCLEYLRHVTALIDEAHGFTTDQDARPWLAKAARTSAHYGGGTGCNLLLTAQRPVDVSPDVRAMVTRLYIFQTLEPGDLEWLARFTQDPSMTERVAGLAVHAWLQYPPEDATHESVSSRDGGGARGAGNLPARAEAEPDPAAARRAQVARG
jgi:hypothetical protein